MSSLSRSRNYGIDLLRIVSMMMVCLIHILGNITPYLEPFSLNYEITSFLQPSIAGAVNLYALISGYVGISAKPKYTNLIYLWLQVAFYSILITIGFGILRPAGINHELVLRALFPVLFSQYWYFTAYFCLFFSMPFLNHLLNTIPKCVMRNTLILFLGLFSVLPTIFLQDPFCVENGFSFLWLMYLYLIGGYVKKFNVGSSFSLKQSFAFYGICISVVWLFGLIIDLFKTQIPFLSAWGNPPIVHPAIVISSFFLLIFFSKLSLARFSKIISAFSPLAFGVYLIHTHPLVYVQLQKWVASFAALPLPLFLLAVLGTLIGLYAVCSGIEYLRQRLFAALKIKERIARCEERLTERFRKPAPCEDKTTEEAYYVSK